MEHINNKTFVVKKTAQVGFSTSPLLNKMHQNSHKGQTKNGAETLTHSGSELLNFFAQAGSMRNNKEEALNLFKRAFAEDRQKAVRVLFYLRDVRGGQGERDLFRICLQWLGTEHSEVFGRIFPIVFEYGRFDDLFFDNEVCFDYVKETLIIDSKSSSPSLLAKWIPTMNASSPKTRAKAKYFAEKLGMSEISYRKMVRDIRKKIEPVETLMSAGRWGEINYSSVPSQASRIYKNAFSKHDSVRYAKFIEKAESGEVKINAATLYPYQIYKSVQNDYSKTLEALWNQLPDYTKGKNALVVADVSGSMDGDPMAVSVSLALYFAERNNGIFKDHFITFSENPVLQRVIGKTLKEKMDTLETAQWDQNTNLQAVFDLILNTAIENNTPIDDMPETIYIISDMEFDSATGQYGWNPRPKTNLEVIKNKYEEAGYKIPNLVFWNVNGSGKNLPAGNEERGVTMVSGFSPVAFSFAVEDKTAEELMMDIINSERYNKIII